jgi:phosphate transport system permease protein
VTELLTHGRLQRWQAAVSAAAGVAVAAGLFAVTPMQGRADFVVVGYMCAVAGYLVTAARIEGRRQAVDRFFHALIVTAVATCLLALGAVLVYTAARGAGAIKPSFFRNTMNGVGVRDTTGGAYHAIVGTMEQVLLASLLAVPAGLLVAIYSVEYGRGRLATILRTTVDVMTGVPSIVAGLFIYAFWVLGLHQGFSGFAAALALALLMLPIVVRSAEESSVSCRRRCARPATPSASRGGARCCRWSCRRRRPASPPVSCCRWRGSPARPRRCC